VARMPAVDKQPRPVRFWHALWLVVFAIDASLVGRGWDHRLGAFLFMMFFGFLILTEVRNPD
jgi:hypothetical protein